MILILTLSCLLLAVLSFYSPRKIPFAVILILVLICGMHVINKPDYAREGIVFYQTQETPVCGATYFDTFMVAYTPTNHQRLVFSGTFVEVEEGFVPSKGATFSVSSPAYTNQAFEVLNPTINQHLSGTSASGSKYAIYGDYIATQTKP